ncbi:MAG TPA: cysteine--tRNA ligase [Streptosporangiaceae bacterium]|nr:cysteine--tRNA ligase [Streptosporangiaceae bacterium]
MNLRLHDTATRTVREFRPLVPGTASLYLCGATVQAPPHIGHLRSGVTFDIVVRWLRATGHKVTFCRNVTDIDDKILKVAAGEGVPWWAIAERNQRAFNRAYDALGCLPPDVEPRATGHVPEMITLIRRLIELGHAYPAEGDVYFDVHSYRHYGELSGQRVEQMRAADDSGSPGKRDPRDFALWKGAKPGEPFWETPWGPGRPGWHLECSAMAMKYLGESFDIHGGGLDLVFPHHENEIAQSKAAGYEFARYWLHNGLVGVAGEKMSKSLGNSLLVGEMLDKVRPAELRYYLSQAHYRSLLEYSPDALAEAVAAYRRIEGFVTRAAELTRGADVSVAEVWGDLTDLRAGDLPPAFAAAMNDDLGLPEALAVVHTELRGGNNALAAGDRDAVAASAGRLRAMLAVLGLDPLDKQWRAAERDDNLRSVIDALVGVALGQRQAARERKDYQAADTIRDDLRAAGVLVEDTAQGSRWELER